MERMLPQRHENTRQHQVPLLSSSGNSNKALFQRKVSSGETGMPIADSQQSFFCPILHVLDACLGKSAVREALRTTFSEDGDRPFSRNDDHGLRRWGNVGNAGRQSDWPKKTNTRLWRDAPPHTAWRIFFSFLSFFLAIICNRSQGKNRTVWENKMLGPTNEPVPLLPRPALVG